MIRRCLALVLGVGLVALATLAFAQGSAPAQAQDPGRVVFFSQGCYGCHRIGIVGTPIAYDLSHIGSKYTESQLADWLRDPVRQKPTAHMPRLALTADEIKALAEYLGSLR